MAEENKNDVERTTYTLKHPVQYGTQTITELKFRPALAGDLFELPLEGRNLGHLFEVLSKLCGETMTVMKSLHPEDMQAIAESVSVF